MTGELNGALNASEDYEDRYVQQLRQAVIAKDDLIKRLLSMLKAVDDVTFVNLLLEDKQLEEYQLDFYTQNDMDDFMTIGIHVDELLDDDRDIEDILDTMED